jgi:flagellar biosynthesis/type III secretory pathway protein FliH
MTPLALSEADNEMHCEIIKEIMTTVWKVFQRIFPKDTQMAEKLVNQQLYEDLQLLLGVSHAMLLRCVLESLYIFL